jgi:flavin reductase (DIM6/NTAB) family NADH-FMN oxidoreductase RutF
MRRLDPGPFVFPMPLVLVASEFEGRPNMMPAAFLGIVNYKPTLMALGLGPGHRTTQGIEAQGVFSVNVPSRGQVIPTDWCGLNSGRTVDKADLFHPIAGPETGAPILQDCALSAELRLVSTTPYSVDTCYIGEVVAVHAQEEFLTPEGKPDWPAIDPLIFTFPDPAYWSLGEKVGRAWSCGKGFEPETR